MSNGENLNQKGIYFMTEKDLMELNGDEAASRYYEPGY